MADRLSHLKRLGWGWYFALLVLICTAFGALAFTSTLNTFLTVDEGSHIPSGYYDLTTGTMKLNPEHPPLLKDVAAVPLLLRNTPTPAYNDFQWTYGANFFKVACGDAMQEIQLARLAVTIWCSLLILLLSLCVWKLWGRGASLLTATLLTASPFMLGYSPLVITDVASGLAQVIALLLAVISMRSKKHRDWWAVAAGLAVGVALLTKFSAALIGLYLPAVFLVAYIRARRAHQPAKHLARIGIILTLVAFVSVVGYMSWHVRNMTSSELKHQQEVLYEPKVPGSNVVGWLAQQPTTHGIASYMIGTAATTGRVGIGSEEGYFLGHNAPSDRFNLAYFPVLFVAKQPVALSLFMIVVLAGLLLEYRRNHKKSVAWWGSGVIVGYLALYGVVALVSRLHIGVRHINVIIIGAAMLTAVGAVMIARKRVWMRYVIGVTVAALIATTLHAYPYFLSYYNALSGGTLRGWYIAGDSNYDWGQDLRALDTWAQQHNQSSIYVYVVQPQIDYPGFMKTQFKLLNDGPNNLAAFKNDPNAKYIAVSTTKYVQNREYYDSLLLVGRPGPSIMVFEKPTN